MDGPVPRILETGLANRHAFRARLTEGLIFAEEADTKCAVLVIDIDHFKRINDTYGHQAGDEVLRSLARILNQTLRKTDTVARYGGEEFAVILPGADAASALGFAEMLRQRVRTLAIAHPASLRGLVTISIGISDKTAATPHAAMLLRDADMALYEAKRRGRDCSVVAAALVVEAAPLAPDAAPDAVDADA